MTNLVEVQSPADLIQRLMDQAHNGLLISENEAVTPIGEAYTSAMRKLIDDLVRVNAVFMSGDQPSYSTWKQLNLDVKSAQVIAENINSFRGEFVQQLGDSLNQMYRDSYNSSIWALDQATPEIINPNYSLPPNQALNIIFQEPWAGARFSDRIWSISDEWARRIQNELVDSILSGRSVADMASDIRDYVGVPDDEKLISRPRASAQLYRATLIARTELIRAARMAQEQVYNDNSDILAGDEMTNKEWSAKAGLFGVCDDCREKNGHTPQEILDMGYGLQSHPNCVLPGQLAFCHDVISATKSFYSGRVVKITTESGNIISVTPNHLIATPFGFVAARNLAKGQQVIHSTQSQGVAFGMKPNDNKSPSLIEDIFVSIKKSSFMSSRFVKTTAKDFNGDALSFQGDVEVVRSNRLLLSYLKSFLFEKLKKFVLYWRNIQPKIFSSFCSFAFCFPRPARTTNSRLSFLDSFFSFGYAHFRSHDNTSFGLGSGFDSSVQQAPSNNASTDIESLRKFEFAHSTEIFPDDIINIEFYNYVGHVYDLQSEFEGLYTVNNILVHNCRCSWIPRLKSWSEMLDPMIAQINAQPGKIQVSPDAFKPPEIEPFQEWSFKYLTPSERGEG